jgi:hypothetical protein
MNIFVSKQAVAAVLVVAGTLCACSSDPSAKKQSPRQTSVVQETYKPTGSHIRERSDGRRSPKNSSSGPVQDLKNAPAVTVIQNQPPK